MTESRAVNPLIRVTIQMEIDKYPDVHKTDIANAIGVSRDTLDRWLSGETALTPDKCQQLIVGLNEVLKRRAHPLIDLTPDGADSQTMQAVKVSEAARASLVNIIQCLWPSDLVTLEAEARRLYRDAHLVPAEFYECTPPDDTPCKLGKWDSMSDDERAEIVQSWQTAMTNANAEMNDAREIEQLHDELEKAMSDDPTAADVDPRYHSWREAEQALRGYQDLRRDALAHGWYFAWPPDHEDDIEYQLLVAKIYEIDQAEVDSNS